MSRVISLIALLACIVIIGILFYKVMIGFLIPLFLAAVLVVVFRPLHRRVLMACNNKHHFAAAITTTIVALLVLVPAGLAGTFAAIQGIGLARNINASSIRVATAKLRDSLELHAPEIDRIRSIDTAINKIQTEIDTSGMKQLEEPNGTLSDFEKSVTDNIAGLKRDYLMKVRARTDEIYQIASENTKDPAELVKLRTSIDRAIAAKEKEIDSYLVIRSEPTSDATAPANSDETSEADAQQPIDFTLPVDLQGAERIADPAILAGIRTLLIDLDRATPRLNDPNDPGNDVDLVALQSRAVELNAEWQRQRTALLGGTVWGFLCEIANPTSEQVQSFQDAAIKNIQPALLNLTGQTSAFLVRLTIGSAIMMVALFFFLYDGPAMIKAIMKLSPLDDRYEMELLTEFDRVVRAIVLALISSAIVQGLTAGIGYYFAGMPWLVFLTLITMLCALIPFVGPAIVWVPVCIYLAVYVQNYWAAGGLAIWGFFAVGSVDNVVKTLVLHGQSSLHPLFALLSILGGVQALGPIGIVVGPIVVTLLQTLLGILQRELNNIDQVAQSVRLRLMYLQPRPQGL